MSYLESTKYMQCIVILMKGKYHINCYKQFIKFTDWTSHIFPPLLTSTLYNLKITKKWVVPEREKKGGFELPFDEFFMGQLSWSSCLPGSDGFRLDGFIGLLDSSFLGLTDKIRNKWGLFKSVIQIHYCMLLDENVNLKYILCIF